jgi:hypothetical protein
VLQAKKTTAPQPFKPVNRFDPRVTAQSGPPKSSVVQRMAVRAWKDFDLETFTYKNRHFQAVLQSSNKKIRPYIGKGIAYTTGMHTCAALAIHDGRSGYSYLLHADATTDAGAIAESLRTYAQFVMNPGSVYARIFTQPGDENSHAVRALLKGIQEANAGLPRPPVETRKKDGTYEVNWDSVVIVGHGLPYIYTKEQNRLDYALKRYARHKKKPEQVEFARDAIISIITGETANQQTHGEDEEDVYLDAAVKAYKENDKPLLALLSKYRQKDYTLRAKMVVEEEVGKSSKSSSLLKPPTPVSSLNSPPPLSSSSSSSSPRKRWSDYGSDEDV